MDLISLIVVLVIVGLALYLVEKVIPMDNTIRIIIRCVILVAVLIWLLKTFGLLAGIRV